LSRNRRLFCKKDIFDIEDKEHFVLANISAGAAMREIHTKINIIDRMLNPISTGALVGFCFE